MYKEIEHCRVSKSKNLVQILSLGEQYLSGVFPSNNEDIVSNGPLDLIWCPDSGLLQLKQSYSLEEMYGDNYGYRSGLNKSMSWIGTSEGSFLSERVVDTGNKSD